MAGSPLPQLQLDDDVLRVKGVTSPVVMPPPGGDGLENSIPRWPPAGPIEPIASLLAQGINRVLVTGVRCAIYQGIRGITAFLDVAMALDWLAA